MKQSEQVEMDESKLQSLIQECTISIWKHIAKH